MTKVTRLDTPFTLALRETLTALAEAADRYGLDFEQTAALAHEAYMHTLAQIAGVDRVAVRQEVVKRLGLDHTEDGQE